MNVTLRQLEIFQVAAKYLNFSKAADILSMSPPAISKQIKSLEVECGCKFFEQIGRNIYLTETGKKFLQQVRTVESEVGNLKEMVLDLSGKSQHIINISLGHTFENTIFKAIKRYTQMYPEIKFNIFIESRADQYKNLGLNTRDLCLICLPDTTKDFNQVKLADIDFVLAIASNHPLAHLKTPQAKDFKEERLILAKPLSKLDHKFYRMIRSSAMRHNECLTLDSYLAIKDAIIAGLGIGFLPRTLIEPKDYPELKILTISKLTYTAPLVILYRKYKKLSVAMRGFIEFLRTMKY